MAGESPEQANPGSHEQDSPPDNSRRDVIQNGGQRRFRAYLGRSSGTTPRSQCSSRLRGLSRCCARCGRFYGSGRAARTKPPPRPFPEHRDKPGSYISFENVSKSFDGFVVLEKVNFCVLPGETLCILGRSGVGKSVSLQMLMGFLKPDSGIIRVAGDDITGYDEQQMQAVRRKVTMVFQNGALFDSISVGENVAFPLRERRELSEDQILQIVKGLLEMVGVAGMEDLLPSDLSTGMKRSVAIARALASTARSHSLRRADDNG